MENQSHQTEGTLNQYIIGFVLSLILTMSAYFAVINEVLPREQLTYCICSLGLVQAVVQLYFFLHLGSERHPRLNMLVFLFMFAVLFITVAGSLWIMAHLNYNMVPQIENLNLKQQRIL
jgi:cytochrome o ubiquinol oxidase subunit IV